MSITKKVKTKVAIFVIFSLTIAMALTGCTGGEKGEEDIAEEKMPKVGIVQIVEHPSLDTIRNSIVEKLEEKGYKDGETLELLYENAQNDTNNLKTICQNFTAAKCDLIIAIATPSAQAALGETKEIPIVFSAVTDPVGAGLVKDLEKPEANITGTSDKISVDKIMTLAKKITPEIKTVGAIYSTGEPNSVSVMKDLKDYAKKNKITVVEATIMNSSEVKQAAESLVGKVDAVFSPIDNTVATAMPAIVDVLNKAKLPYYVAADSLVADGGLATDGVNYVELGYETGDMVISILEGEKIENLPVRVMEKTQVYINSGTARAIGVEIPKDVAESAKDLCVKCPVE